MNTLIDYMNQIAATLKHHAGKALHGHQAKTLALFTLGMARCRHCCISRIAAFGADAAKPLSRQRRLQRFLANERVRVEDVAAAVMAKALAPLKDCRILLLLDETPLANDLRCMKVSVAYHGRAVPIAWRCYKTNAPPLPRGEIIRRLLERASQTLPQGADIILMADRGLSDSHLIDLARRFSWHFVLRLQRQTRVLVEGEDAPCSLGDLQEKHGTWLGRARAFQDAGWRDVNLVAVPGAAGGESGDPWLLATDLPATRRCCRLYRRRMWQEESFRDEKSSGFCWQASKVLLPLHAERLLLVMALAQLMLLVIGQSAVRRGERTLFEPRGRRQFSIFQIGCRFLLRAIDQAISLKIAFQLPDACGANAPARAE